MPQNTDHVIPNTPRGNNPNASRFDKSPKKSKDHFPRIAYVLQGGGALGAYQAGALKELLTAGFAPDWIAATSIGAIQAAIVAGNPPETRLKKLTEFWDMVATYSIFEPLSEINETREMHDQMMENSALISGQPNFYFPRWYTGQFPTKGDPSSLSYYNTAPLRDTLLKLVDFDYLNSSPVRLSLGSVSVNTGHLVYFNNINYLIGPEHVMASAALPPGFPAIEIDGEFYWDGGVHSNSPLQVILEASPAEDTLCFLIDCFGGHPFVPTNMNQITERMKDITYSMHGERMIRNYLYRQKMEEAIVKLYDELSPEQKKKHARLIGGLTTSHHCTLVHLAYSIRIVNIGGKDYNFGKKILEKREEIGSTDVKAALAEKKKWALVPENRESRLYEAPNNLSRLFRKKEEAL